jgi:hypothetical protein
MAYYNCPVFCYFKFLMITISATIFDLNALEFLAIKLVG